MFWRCGGSGFALVARTLQQGWSGCDGAEDIKQSGVCGNLQIEVKEAMNQDSGEPQRASQGNGAADIGGPVTDFSQGIAIENDQKPHHDGKAEHSGLGQQLQVVVVGLVDKEVGIERTKFGVDHGEGSKSPAQ